MCGSQHHDPYVANMERCSDLAAMDEPAGMDSTSQLSADNCIAGCKLCMLALQVNLPVCPCDWLCSVSSTLRVQVSVHEYRRVQNE